MKRTFKKRNLNLDGIWYSKSNGYYYKFMNGKWHFAKIPTSYFFDLSANTEQWFKNEKKIGHFIKIS